MNRWIFLRHGESEANQRRVFSGHQDVELTERGREQAFQAGTKIRAMLGSDTIKHAFCSDLRRAKDTAEIALSSAKIDTELKVNYALRERHLGAWQGHCIDTLKESGQREILFTWHGAAPGGESLAQIALRAVQFLSSTPTHGPTIVVAHGGLIRALLGLLDKTDKAEIGRVNIPNAEPIERYIKDGTWIEIMNELNG